MGLYLERGIQRCAVGVVSHDVDQTARLKEHGNGTLDH